MTDLAPGTDFAGCRIVGIAGRGGMGVVYSAIEQRLQRPVALKLIAPHHAADAEFRERFERESRLAASIDHPNIIPVYAAGEEDDRPYLVMRLVQGTDLQALVGRRGRLDAETAARLVAQVAAALDAAHAAGLVHRDVKPANVLLDGDHVYLTDFGLTRLAKGDSEDFTEVGRWMGTVDFSSPEQLRGERTDARSDVYALGCVLFTAVTGKPPHGRDTVPASMHAHLTEPVPHTGTVFDGVLGRALAKAPDDRFPSAGDLGRAALAAARGEKVTEEERVVATGPAAPDPDAHTIALPTPTQRAEPIKRAEPIQTYRSGKSGRVRRFPLALGVLALAGLAAVAGLAIAGAGGPGPPPLVEAVTDMEVRDAVDAFAAAYSAEDAAALGRLVTDDVARVLPGDSQTGRTDVVAVYAQQFDDLDVITYEVSDVDVLAGEGGRGAGEYLVRHETRKGERSFGGSFVFGVVKERGRVRIRQIVAMPAV